MTKATSIRGGPTSSRILWTGIGLVSIGIAAWFAYRPFLDLALLGFDSYPTILTARIQGLGDLLGTFTEELMDGRYPDGHFYRPVTNLSFAVDHALWGLNPVGYHRTDLAILILNGFLIFALVRRLLGAGRPLAGFLAALIFVLHPGHVEVLPVAPRRADTLCLAFLAATLLAQPKGGGGRGRAWGAALLALCAVGSKETGVIVTPLVFALCVVEGFGRKDSGGEAPRRLLLSSLVRTTPTLAATVLFLAARTWVLGGLGGHAASDLSDIKAVPRLIEPYLGMVLLPEQFVPDGLAVAALSGLLLSALALTWWTPDTGSEDDRPRTRRGIVFATVLAASLLAVASLSGQRIEAWYVMFFVVPFALLLGILLDSGLRGSLRRRPTAIVSCLLAAGLGVQSLRHSSLFHEYETWARASRMAQSFLSRVDREMADASAGSTILLDRFPLEAEPPARGPGVRSAVILAPYSLQAYAELIRPDLQIEVRQYSGGAIPRAPSWRCVLWVTPLRLPR